MTCRTCDCADKAADTDEWVTFAKRPEILPLSAPAAPTPVTFSWQHQRSEQEARARRAEAEVTRLTAERDALAAQVARVEKLAEDWRYKGQFGWGPWQLGEGPDPEGYVMNHCASALSDALAGSETDTTDTQPTDQEDQS